MIIINYCTLFTDSAGSEDLLVDKKKDVAGTDDTIIEDSNENRIIEDAEDIIK